MAVNLAAVFNMPRSFLHKNGFIDTCQVVLFILSVSCCVAFPVVNWQERDHTSNFALYPYIGIIVVWLSIAIVTAAGVLKIRHVVNVRYLCQPINFAGMMVHSATALITLTAVIVFITNGFGEYKEQYALERMLLQTSYVIGSLPIDYILINICKQHLIYSS